MSDSHSLRILAVCSRPLIDDGGNPIPLLDVAEERRRVETGLRHAGDVARVHFLPEATTGEVKSALREGWDVVHFTGHGTEDGRLLLEDGYGVAHFLSRQETAQLFTGQNAGQKTPLVVLSACHSETVGRELHAAGVPAVVAVDARVPIADLAAIIFAEHFYAALAKSWDVRRAFDDARETVALNSEVGDARPPKDEQGKDEEPWSKRFLLLGDAGAVAVAPTGTHGAAAAAPPTQAAGNLERARGTSFVGRAKEIVEVVKAFDRNRSRRVCVYGSGGLGKTELARAVARWYMERERVGAVLWASASHVEGDYKLRDLASLLGVAMKVFPLPVTEQSMFEEQKRAVREFLGDSRALVLLDNWETIEREHRRELWDFALSLPEEVRVLVTSRDVLPPKDAFNYELETLAPDDAVELFVNIARNAGYFKRNSNPSGEELAILDSICERLSGYPLAIEVVAGQTISRTPSDIWADLQRVPRDVLEGKDEVTGEPRGIWTSLDLSYNVLPDPEQTMFRRMCVLLAPASAEDIAAITDTPTPRPVLDTLVKRSLVRMREGAYSLLPIVRDYAQDKLTAVNQDPRELHLRAVNHYGQKNTIEGALTASDHLFELAARFNVRDAAELFVGYVSGFYVGLVTRGYWAESRSKATQLITVASALDNKQMEAHAICELGICHYQLGEYDYAMELQRKAQRLYEETGDRRGVAFTLHQLGMLAQAQGSYGEAERLYRQSLELREELGDKSGVASSLHQLGTLIQAQGDYKEAERLYRRSLEEETEDKVRVASSVHHLGMMAQDRGNYEEAERLYRQSLAIEKELGNKVGVASSLHQLGVLAQVRGDEDEAKRLYRQSFNLRKELGDRKGVAGSLHQLGMLAKNRGDYGEAERLYQQSLEITQSLGDKSGVASTMGELGGLSYAQGQRREALNYFLIAHTIFEQLHAPDRRLMLSNIARVQEAVGEEQFAVWLRELSTEAERISSLLVEQRAKDFIEQLTYAVTAARGQGCPETHAALAQYLARLEAGAREQGVDIADFFAVLRGLLTGENVAEKITALTEPFKRLAELARAACEAEGREG